MASAAAMNTRAAILRRGTGGCGGGTVGRAVLGEPPPTGTTGILPVDTYSLVPNTPEPEIVAHLFKLYAEKMKG